MNTIIARSKEQKELKSLFKSTNSEFVAVYGRRRVGKTFLIRESANDNFAFYVTGVHNATKEEQLTNFAIALQKYSKCERLNIQKNWILAFYSLSQYLESLPKGEKIIFFDELPWMDTPKSNFIAALENFWNSWAALRDDIKLVVCGSATSWIINNLINSRGGLHNRLTHKIILEPFTLSECEEYFTQKGYNFSQKQIAECYMVMGGIPYYFSLMNRAKGLAQNIDYLFFAPNAPLRNEFKDLYAALFKKSEPHIAIVTALSNKSKGLTRNELIKVTKLENNGALSIVLEELCQCGFIRSYENYSESYKISTKQRRGTVYQLIDFYTLFYFHFVVENSYSDEHFWTNSINSQVHNTWSGLSFEILCLVHLPQIKKALGISGVLTRAFSWRNESDAKHTQIDLLIDRKDDTINICEMKYYKDVFTISKDYEDKLCKKILDFQTYSKTKKTIILTMITCFGIKDNQHSDIVQAQILLEELFI